MREEAVAVEAANTAFYNALERADLDLLEAVWMDGSSSSEVLCVHPGWPTLRGRPEILRSFAVILANTPYVQFFLTDLTVTLAGEVAVVNCVENILTGIDDGSDGSGAFSGGKVVATNVFRRTPGGWRLWLHHASPVLAEEEDEDSVDEELH